MAKSEYLQREEAAKKQLGTKGVKKRVKQLPTAARASLREMTGIDISRKGVSVDPFGVAMALPIGKVLKAAKVLRAAGKASQATALEARLGAKEAGKFFGGTGKKSQGLGLPMDRAVDVGGRARDFSESVFPRASTGTLRSISNLNPETARSAAKSFGQAASGERGLARSLRGVAGERNRSMNLFKDSLANQRAGKAISKYKTPKVGR